MKTMHLLLARLPKRASAAVCAALCCSAAMAQVPVPPPMTSRIEVFTNSSILLTGTEGVKIYYVDGLEQLENELSQGLPNDPQRAAQIARDRLRMMGATLQKRAMNAGEGITRASYYGVNRVPAVVFDGKAIVYGVTDIRRAVALYEQSAGRARR
ncbi:MAG TPA: TIGR03757 family integrating conjugative element protein [Noviherbaspirillum sp.]